MRVSRAAMDDTSVSCVDFCNFVLNLASMGISRSVRSSCNEATYVSSVCTISFTIARLVFRSDLDSTGRCRFESFRVEDEWGEEEGGLFLVCPAEGGAFFLVALSLESNEREVLLVVKIGFFRFLGDDALVGGLLGLD